MDGWIRLSGNDGRLAKYVNRRSIVSVNDMDGGIVAVMRNGDTVGMPELPPDEPKLPYDAEVEYLESDGTRWIDTGVLGGPGLELEVHAQYKYRASHIIRAAYYSNGTLYNIFILTGSSQNNIQGAYNKSGEFNNLAVNLTFGNWFSAKLSNRSLTVNETTVSSQTGSMTEFTGASTLGVLGYYNAFTGATTTASGVVAWVKIRKDGTLVRDFIPVRVGTVGYLYDRANPTGGPLGNGLYGDFSDGKGGVTGFPANLVGPDKPSAQ